MEDMKYVEKSAYIVYCDICHQGVDKFVDTGGYSAVCVDCVEKLHAALPKPGKAPVKGGKK